MSDDLRDVINELRQEVQSLREEVDLLNKPVPIRMRSATHGSYENILYSNGDYYLKKGGRWEYSHTIGLPK